MNKLIQVLRSRKGESMVEILVSTVVFMLLLGALNGAVGFAANAQQKAEEIRQDAAELQKSVREVAPADNGSETYGFYPDGHPEWVRFRVEVQKQTIPAQTGDGKTVTFYRFGHEEDTP